MGRKKDFDGPTQGTPVALTVEQYEAIRRIAFDERRTQSSLVREAVAAWLAQRKNGGKPKAGKGH